VEIVCDEDFLLKQNFKQKLMAERLHNSFPWRRNLEPLLTSSDKIAQVQAFLRPATSISVNMLIESRLSYQSHYASDVILQAWNKLRRAER
jgi:hypothetical protein